MRSIGVFGEPVCKCMDVCACVNMFMSGAVQVDQTMKRGLGVLSIGTAPPRARWTEGMRYIVKPKNKISAEKRKKPSRPGSGASSHPLRTEVRLRNVRNLSRTKIKTEEKRRFVVLPKLESKPLDNTSCVYPNITSRFQPIRAISITTKSGY